MVMDKTPQLSLILVTPEGQHRIARRTRIRRIAIGCVLAVAILAPDPLTDLPITGHVCTVTPFC